MGTGIEGIGGRGTEWGEGDGPAFLPYGNLDAAPGTAKNKRPLKTPPVRPMRGHRCAQHAPKLPSRVPATTAVDVPGTGRRAMGGERPGVEHETEPAALWRGCVERPGRRGALRRQPAGGDAWGRGMRGIEIRERKPFGTLGKSKTRRWRRAEGGVGG